MVIPFMERVTYWARDPELPFSGKLVVFSSGAGAGAVFAVAWG